MRVVDEVKESERPSTVTASLNTKFEFRSMAKLEDDQKVSLAVAGQISSDPAILFGVAPPNQ